MTTEPPANKLRKWLTYALIILASTGVGLLVLLYFRRRVRPTGAPPESVTLPQQLIVTGLSEAEAAARLEPGQYNLIERWASRTRWQMIREGALTIFNLNLVGLGFVQVLLGRPLDALISAGILLFSVGVTVFQEEFARYRIRALQQTIRPQTTVIRDGRPRSIEANQIVVGDALSSGSGDQIMVDGVVAQGGRFAGWSLYVKDGVVKYVHNWFDVEYSYVEATEKLPAGTVNIRYHFDFDGGQPGAGGTGRLYYNDKLVGEGQITKTVPFVFSADETLDVGGDLAMPVTNDYPEGEKNKFKGTVNWVRIDLEDDDVSHLEPEEQKYHRIIARQ